MDDVDNAWTYTYSRPRYGLGTPFSFGVTEVKSGDYFKSRTSDENTRGNNSTGARFIVEDRNALGSGSGLIDEAFPVSGFGRGLGVWSRTSGTGNPMRVT